MNPILRPVAALLLLATFSPWASSSRAQDVVSLKQAVAGRYKMGVGVSDNIPERPKDWTLLTSQFEIVTPENSMKTESVQPQEGTFTFATSDRFVAFAKANQLEVVGHCLIWAKDDRTSAWWHQDGDQPTSKEKLFARMKTHIDTVVGRYAQEVTMWDVVNEALDDGSETYLRDSIWTRTAGEEFIVKAFQFTRANDPDALLIYNDYNSEYPGKRENTIRLLKSLQAQGAPIDAFGMQGHFELDAIKFDDLDALFNDLRPLGLKVVVSELDIDVIPRSRWWAEGGKYRDELASTDPYRLGCPPEVLQRQAEQYGKLFTLFKKHEDIIARISFWNLHDGESWLNEFPWKRVNHPLLFDRDGRPKPAFQAVVDAIK